MSSSSSSKERSFAVVAIARQNGDTVEMTGGRYLSSNPRSAALKVYGQAVKHIKTATKSSSKAKAKSASKSPKSKFMEALTIEIRESTRGKKGSFKYQVKREKLKEPIVLERKAADGSVKKVSHWYKVVATSLKSAK